MNLRLEDLPDLVRGAAFLGTGGGGDPYVGRLMVERCLRGGKTITIIGLQDVPDDALIVPTAMMGAPTVLVEKVPRGDEAVQALKALEDALGQPAFATMPIECGGINSTIPLVVAAELGIPVVDADGMGRAFPELYMETFHVYGVSGTPMAICDENRDRAILTTHDNFAMEWLARGVTIRMGGCAYIAEYAMNGRTARHAAIPGTLSLALQIGRCIRDARARHADPFQALAETLAATPYQHGRVVFEGRITAVERQTREGFARGSCTITGLGGSTLRLRIDFQNENLAARRDGDLIAIVPDLICVLEADTAEPVTTERLRYGLLVKVMVVSTPPLMRTPEALAVFGPRAFGLPDDFIPVEELAATGGD